MTAWQTIVDLFLTIQAYNSSSISYIKIKIRWREKNQLNARMRERIRVTRCDVIM